jgi:hypothetical protein
MTPQSESPRRTKITSTVVKEDIPADSAQRSEKYAGSLWEVVHSLPPKEWMANGGDHMARIYRCDENGKSLPTPPENKFVDHFDEKKIFDWGGGGSYMVWLFALNGGKLVVPTTRVDIEGQPKNNIAGSYYRGQQFSDSQHSSGGDPRVDILIEEIRELRRSSGAAMLHDTMKQSIDIMASTFKAAATVVRENSPTPAATTTTDAFKARLEEAMLSRLLAPPPDPMAGIQGMVAMGTAIVTAVKDLSGSLGLAGGAAKPDLMSKLVDVMPQLTEKAFGGLHEWRLGEEARATQARAAAATRVIDAEPPNPGRTAATTPTTQASAPTPAQPPAPAPPVSGITDEVEKSVILQWTMKRIAKIIEESDKTQASGEDLYNFLESVGHELIDELKGLTRDQIIANVFRSQPLLMKVADHPRLPKMIDEFLVIANIPAKMAPN